MIKNCFCLKSDAGPQTVSCFIGLHCFARKISICNHLAVRSLEALETNLRARKQPIRIITGHTGWTDDLDFAFRHRTEICSPFTKKYKDPSAPYDGYIEDDDTEKGARTVPLRKVAAK